MISSLGVSTEKRGGCTRLLTVLICLMFAISAVVPCHAEVPSAPTTIAPTNPHPVNMDLSASTPSGTAARAMAVHNVQAMNINVGGTTQQITAATLLTPAQRVAVFQVLSTGRQSILLGPNGNAVGGTFTVDPRMSQHVSNLVIPQGVTAIDKLTTSGTLSLLGNLTNAGTFYVVSTNPAVTTGTLTAANITNQQGALLSSVLPDGGLPGISSAVANLGLSLNAANNFVNAGTITSAGELTVTAGGSIVNALPAGAAGPSPVIQGANDIELTSRSGDFINSGVITSLCGDINIASQMTQKIEINSVGGTLLAANGNINVRDAGFSLRSNLTIFGGTYVSQQFNLYSGSGTIEASLGTVTGRLTSEAGVAHIRAHTPNLVLGKQCISGDPTYYNTGDIQISGDISVAEDLAIIAGGNITSTSGFTSITARDGTGQGHNITLVAGANVSPTCEGCSTNGQPGSESTTTVTITPGSPNGGNIDLSASPNLLIDSSSNTGNLNGRNVTLAAFASAPIGGQVVLPASSVVQTSGSGSGNNGNITLIAGSASGNGVTCGQLIANGGSGTAAGTGQVNITTAQPTTSDGAPIIFGMHGDISSGNSFTGSTVVQLSSVRILNNVNAINGINILSGTDITGTTLGDFSCIDLPGSGGPTGIAVNPTGTRVYVAQKDYNNLVNNVYVVDTSTNAIVATVPVGYTADGIAVNSSGTYAYVAIVGGGYVSVIDTNKNSEVARVSVGGFPYTVALNQSGTFAYAVSGSYGADYVSVIDTSNNTVVASVPVGEGPQGVAVNPAGTFVYVANNHDNTVSVINTRNSRVVATVPVGLNPWGVAINPAGTFAYVANEYSNSVSVIDTSTNTVVATIPVGSVPRSVAINAAGTYVYVTNYNNGNGLSNGTLSVIDTVTNTVVNTLPAGIGPWGIAVNATGTMAYVANEGDDNVYATALHTAVLTTSGTTSITTTNGNIGVSAAKPVTTAAGLLSVNAGGTNANAYISQMKSVTLLSSSATGEFNLSATGDLTVNAATGILAETGDLTLKTTSNGDIKLIAGQLSSVTGSVNLTTGGTGNIITHGHNLVINAGNSILLAPGGGTIDATTTGGTAGSVQLTAGTVVGDAWICVYRINASSASSGDGGTISILDYGTGGIIIRGDLLADAVNGTGGNITLSDTSGGLWFQQGNPNALSVSVVNSGQAGNIALSGSFITANQGTIVLSATGAGGGKDGTITISTTAASPNGDVVLGPSANGLIAHTPNGHLKISAGGSLTIDGNVTSTGSLDANASTVVLDNSLTARDGISLNSVGDIIGGVAMDIVASIYIGTSPDGLVVLPAGTYAYVGNAGGSSVSVVDVRTGAIVATIPIPYVESQPAYPQGLATNPTGTLVYVANSGTGNLSVIDTKSNTIVSSIPTLGAREVAINSSGTFAYVTGAENSVYVINTSTNSVVDTIAVGELPNGISVNSTGKYVYVANRLSNDLSVIDTSTNTVVATIPVGANPYSVVTNATGTVAYVANWDDKSISVVNTSSYSVIATVPLSASPLSLAINPAGTSVCVTMPNDVSPSISLVDTATNTVTFSTHTGPGADRVAFNPSGTLAFVTTWGGKTLQEISLIAHPAMLTSSGTVSLTTTNGNIGTTSQPINTAAGSLTANAAGAQMNAYINQMKSVTLLNCSASGIFNLTANGDLASSAGTAITGAVIQLTSAGSLGLAGTVAGTISVSIRAANSIVNGDLGTIITPALSLTSTGGSIGASGAANALNVSVANLSLRTEGSGDVYVNQTGPMTLDGSSAGGRFELTCSGMLTTVGAVVAGSVVLQTAANSNASISLGASVASGSFVGDTVTVAADGSGAITQLAGTLTAHTLNLRSGTGSIGAIGTEIQTAASNLTVNTGGNVYICQTGATNVGTSGAGSGNVFQLTSTGTVTTTGTISGQKITLKGAADSNASFRIGGSIIGGAGSGDSVTITTDGTGGISQIEGVITANTIHLSSGTGNVGSGGASIQTAASVLTVNTGGTGNTYISNSGALAICASSAGGVLQIQGDDNVTATDRITAGHVVLQSTGSSGAIDVASSITGITAVKLATQPEGTGNVTITGALNCTAANAVVTVSAYGLDFGSGSINAGTGTVRLQPNGNQNVRVGGTGGASSFYVSAGELQRVTAGTLSIGDSGKTGTVYLSGNINVGGAGPAGIYNLELLSGGSYVGTGRAITLGGKTLSVSAGGTIDTGWVSGGVQGVPGVNQIQFEAGGALYVNGNLTTQKGSIVLSAGAGKLSIQGGRTIRANEGNVTIQNNDTTSGLIKVGAEAAVGAYTDNAANTSYGNVNIVIGAIPPSPVTGSRPAGVVVNTVNTKKIGTSAAYFGDIAGGVYAQGSNNTVNVINRSVVFSTYAPQTISLGGRVVITADPPIVMDSVSENGLTALSSEAVAHAASGMTLPVMNAQVQDEPPVTSGTLSATRSANTNAGARLLPEQAIGTEGRWCPEDTSARTGRAAPRRAQEGSNGTNPADASKVPGQATSSPAQERPNGSYQEDRCLDGSIFEGIDSDRSGVLLFDRQGLRMPEGIPGENRERTPAVCDMRPVSTRGCEGVISEAVMSRVVHSGIEMEPDGRTIILKHGKVIFAAGRQLTVRTPEESVSIGAGAVVLICASRNGLSVYNLHDCHGGDVSISTGRKRCQVNLGEHVTIASHKGDGFEDVNLVPSITHADLQSYELPAGKRLFRSKFSIFSALTGLEPLTLAKHSSNREDISIRSLLIKDAAILMQTRSRSGGYRRIDVTRSVVAARN